MVETYEWDDAIPCPNEAADCLPILHPNTYFHHTEREQKAKKEPTVVLINPCTGRQSRSLEFVDRRIMICEQFFPGDATVYFEES